MKIDRMVLRLEAWAKRHKALSTQSDALHALTRADADCALMEPVWDVWRAYTVAVSELIGDTNEWLQWYQEECNMGKTPKVVRLSGRTIKVRTLRQLATVIRDGNHEA